MYDDRTMLPCGPMVEVALIYELAVYVGRLNFAKSHLHSGKCELGEYDRPTMV
jgi:hypothetical protein